MTSQGLLFIVGILSVIRGGFLLFPGLRVRPFWLKAGLLIAIALVFRYAGAFAAAAPPDQPDAPPFDTRRFTLLATALMAVLFIPNGTREHAPDESDEEGDEGSSETAHHEAPPAASTPPSALSSAWSREQTRVMLEYLDSIIVAGVTALFLIHFVVRSFYIPSESMVPTLAVNDMILVDELVYDFYRPGRGDIVVFRPPERAHSEGKDFIKRVIAVEGDTVRVTNDVTYVNDQPLVEPYRNPPSDRYGWQGLRTFDPVTVPPDHVFCMGDNRPNSEDSRYWGAVPVKNIVGKAFLTFYPLRRARLLR